MFHNVNFHASVADVFDRKGNRVPRELGRGVYRDDTGELLSIVGPQYQPVQHMDVLQPILDGLDTMGYDVIEKDRASRHDFYDLKGKQAAWVSPKITDNGAVMRTDVILGNFIEPTGHTNYLAEGPDTNFFRISILNSHNMKYAVRANYSYLRLICMNGMTQPTFTASTYGKHTSGFSIDGLKRQLKNAMDAMDGDADRFGLWAKTPVSLEQATEFLKLTIAKLSPKPDGTPHFSQPLLDKILRQFNREDQTLWGLYNAVTYWQSHDDFRKNADVITATIGREQKVAAMLKSRELHEMFAI